MQEKMPKIKVDHIVTFSSEDSVNVATNVLNSDAGKKWKCRTPGEKSASIIFQLEKASLITGIDIGNEHSAYVEVLVNRSSSTDDYKVLVVMSSFMTPLESRQSTNVNKVRMFSYNDLRSPERDEKWDRIKIVCTQPFNPRVQYGLSFVTLHSTYTADSTTTPAKMGNFTLRPESPDNIFVGNLFARRKEFTEPLSAAAAIRKASTESGTNKHSPKCKAILKDVPSTSKINDENKTPSKPRNRNELLYNDDEEKPNTKIDKVIDQKNKEKQLKEATELAKIKKESKKPSNKNPTKQDQSSNKHEHKASTSTRPSDNKRKLIDKDTPQKRTKPNRATKPFNELLSGVTIVISGIENPERSNIRNEALSMGAKYRGDWDNTCTHLVCAFTNTPKFTQVKGKGKIVNRMWVNDCYTQHKRFPWRRYALDLKDQTKDESEEEIWEKEKSPEPTVTLQIDSDGSDTEDEIERIRNMENVKDKKQNGLYSAETDEENIHIQNCNNIQDLPELFLGKVLYIDKELSENTRILLSRYITAYNGILVNDATDVVDFAIASPTSSGTLKLLCSQAKIVRPDWIWECHNAKKLVPDLSYRLEV